MGGADKNKNKTSLQKLKRKREDAKQRLYRIQQFIAQYTPDQNLNQIRAREQAIHEAFKEFNQISEEIEDQTLLSNLDAETDDEKIAIEELYFELLASVQTVLESNNHKPSQIDPQSSQSYQNGSRINLPKITIPTFNGSYENWLSFKDTYVSLIHDNKDLTEIEKMHYLKSSVSGEALRTIETIAISSANYGSAWKLLEERFAHERLIIQEHLKNIINSPKIVKPTASSLRQLMDDIRTNLASLRVLKRPVDHWDDILLTIVTEKLDFHSNREWQSGLTKVMPKLKDLIDFIEKRCQYFESLASSNKTINQPQTKSVQIVKPGKTSSSFATTRGKPSCPLCKKDNHFLYQCNTFLKLNVGDRIKQVDSLNLCKNCLRGNHDTLSCKSSNGCRECKSRHNSLLHVNVKDLIIEKQAPSSSSVNHCTQNSFSEKLLSTALVLIKDHKGQYQKCRALLDGGSQSNFVTKNLCKRLQLKTRCTEHNIMGINSQHTQVTEIANIQIKSNCSNFTSFLTCLVLDNITTNLPSAEFSTQNLKIPSNIRLADNEFNKTAPIDLLIGTELFLGLLTSGRIELQKKKLYLQNTCLGWIVGGHITLPGTQNLSTSVSNLSINSEKAADKQLEKFWQVEGYDYPNKVQSKEEKDAENHFLETFKRDINGRFIVKLPIKNNSMQLGNSYNKAKQRFLNLEKKFASNSEFKLEYQNFMHEYIKLGHMELISVNEINRDPVNAYYLPHHAVFKDTNTSKQIRVVFDASAKSSNNKSLNDNLLIGPNIQQDLLSILTRFRAFQYVLSADIIKMYRQIKIDEEHQDYHRILWRDAPTDELQIFRLTTLTYGTATAPFLAIRCLQQLAMENKHKYPQASEIILRDFYMDDLLTGSNSLQDIVTLREDLIQLLRCGGFELAKWASNDDSCLPNISEKSPNGNTIINIDENGETKTLGLIWNYAQDILKYKVQPISLPKQLTKRNMLKIICRIFDPIGLISPIIIKAKIIMQQLWLRNLDWDEPVPSDIGSAWTELVSEFNNINDIQIPRKVLLKNSIRVELHGFADASEKAYGASIYIRSIDDKGEINVQLLVAKSRVAPLKALSIPRLELLAAQLLTQITTRVINDLNIEIHQQYLWTDSTIVLSWLSQESVHWQTFVANRVSQIQNLSDIKNWRHIGSVDNPADIISRGQLPSQLQKNDLWWHGPSWLKQSQTHWPISNFKINLDTVPEKKKTTISSTHLATTEQDGLPIINKISNFSKLKRIIGYINRFIYNSRNVNNQIKGHLTIKEMVEANDTIMKLVQKSFPQEIRTLTKNQELNKSSAIAKLNPFLDQKGILRVGGRLQNANISYDKKHPIVIPKDHHVTKLIIQHYHLINLHAGAQATLAAIRQNYWPISGRGKVRQVLHNCIKCFKARPSVLNQKMGNLPTKRLEPARPFINTGIDYCGPILIKSYHGRGKQRISKSYVCLFICLCTKAVHLELVGDLTAEGFLNALKRFISRRGFVKYLTSDNATNFVKANKDLKELEQFFNDPKVQNKLITTLANQNIEWSFIPPRSPNFGGLWESSIKSVKHHLKRVIGEAILTYEEMYTLLAGIEACLNSRPLLPLSSDPNDLVALTPSHLLIGEVLTAPLEYDLTELKVNRLSRYQLIEQLRQHFWGRWRREYINQLQTRNKWTSASKSLQPGDLVLMVEDNTPPLIWPMGRVESIHPGKDGMTRVVTVKTSKGFFKRAISKVCLLPTDD